MNKVYIELVFLDNFIVNGLIVAFAAVLTKTQKRWGRYAAAAAVGGVYACFASVFGGVLTALPLKMLVGLMMCGIAFYVRGGKNLLRNICAFYAVTFVFAGAIYATVFANGNTAPEPLLRCVLIGLGVGAALIAMLSRVRKRALMRARQTVDIRLAHQGKQTTVRAYVDTGNLLTDPISGLGVVFLTKAAAEGLFDRQTLALMQGAGDAATDRLRIIPAATASGSTVLFGIEIDDVAPKHGQTHARAVVCIAKTTLTEGCGAIVGPSVIDELLKGAQHDNTTGTKGGRMDTIAAEDRGKHRLYQRQRGTSAASEQAGGSGAAAGPG